MGNNNTIFSSPTSHADSALVVRSMRDEKPVHYTLKIQAFSLLKRALASSKRHRFESQIFKAGGYKWKLALYPKGDKKRNGSGHISLYLVTAENDISSTTLEVNAVFTFLVYDNLRDKYLAVQDGKIRRFHGMKTEWGFEKLLSVDTFNDASNGFLVGDCCAFGVDIFVNKCDDGGKGEVVSLIKQPRNNIYTWNINNFSLHQTYYDSDPFTVEGYRWRIRLYPKGCSLGTPDSLSLYLDLDNFEELPQSSQVYVEYEMAILSQLGVEPRKAAHNCWFNSVECGWGTPSFMSLSDLKEPTNGFICHDTVVVEVKINVVSNLEKYFKKVLDVAI